MAAERERMTHSRWMDGCIGQRRLLKDMLALWRGRKEEYSPNSDKLLAKQSQAEQEAVLAAE